MNKEELYNRIETAIKTDETGTIMAAQEIAQILDEVANTAEVIRFVIVATRTLAWEAQASTMEVRAQNMRQNAEAARHLITW